MSHSLFQRLFRQKKRGSEARSPSLGDTVPGTPSGDAADQEERKPLESGPGTQNTGAGTKVISLFAFVDTTNPFTPGEITGLDLPGPILSILSAKRFDSVFLLYTPQTRENAFATEAEIARRHTGCRVRLQQMPVSDPKDYASLMAGLWRYGRDLLRRSDAEDNYVCLSSGPAEMRATWFLLTKLGIVKAKLLQVEEMPSQLLFGRVSVKELRLDKADWRSIRELAVRWEHFDWEPTEKVEEHPPESQWSGPLSEGLRLPQPRRRKFKDGAIQGESTADATAFGFDKAFVERMRMLYGDMLADLLLPLLWQWFLSKNVPPDKVQALTDDTLGGHLVLRVVGTREPASFGRFLNSVSNNVLLEYYRASGTSPGTEEFDPEGPNVLSELKLTPGQVESLRQATPALHFAFLEVPLGAGENIEESVSSDRRESETPESEGGVIRGTAAEEPLREEAPAEKEPTPFGGPKSRKARSGAPEAAPAEAEEDLRETVLGKSLSVKSITSDDASAQFLRDKLAIPGLDDALQELGIYVGSAVLRHAAERAGIAAESDLPVLLLGETGTGKERFAHLIHRMSPRGRRDLVAVNCAAIPEPLAESYLFGHVKGAFSGATSDKKGMFESADQSTLFLDEVAELSLEVQAKLLRVIQDGVVQRLGGAASRKVEVRVIAASNRDLGDQVRAGKFREDLYFRLEVVQIKLPALRERRGEIPELALALLRQINLRRRKPRQLSSAALMRLERYDWPGNVRQLSNVLERSVLYAPNDSIDADDLLITDHRTGKDPLTALPEPFPGFKLETFLTQVREQLFLRALAACNGNQTETAERLGVTKQAVSKFVAGKNDNQD